MRTTRFLVLAAAGVLAVTGVTACSDDKEQDGAKGANGASADTTPARTDCTVEPEDGGCRLTIEAEGEFKSRIMRLLSPLAIAVAKRQADGDVKKLKAALESRTAERL